MYYIRFIKEWIDRSEREKKYIDDGDRFISLWIAFNGWLKKKYGESRQDRELINKVVQNPDLEQVFNWLAGNDKQFQNDLNKLSTISVVDMRDETDESRYKKFTGNFESFIRVVYQIRCNLFHGRKSVGKDKVDLTLIRLALRLLGPVFKKYLKEKEPILK